MMLFNLIHELHWTKLSVILVAVVGLYLYIKRKYEKNNGHSLPALAPTTMIEAVKNLTGPNTPWFYLDMARKSENSIYRLPLPFAKDIFVIGGPSVAKKILRGKATDKPRLIYAPFDPVVGGPSIASRSNDHKWKAARKGIAHAFSSSEIARMNRICSDHADQWIANTLKSCVDNERTFDPSREMCRVVFNSILESAFEYTNTTEEFDQFEHNLKLALTEFAAKQPLNPLRKYYAPLLSEYRAAVKSCEQLHILSKQILDAYRANKNKSTNKTVIRLINDNSSYASDDERIADITMIIIAGHDTTGYTLATTLILLAKHPNVCEKLRKELLSMEEDKRRQSQYLKHVVKESQRLLPVGAALSVREPGQDILYDNGSKIIPAKSICLIPQLPIHRCEQVFKDPDEFCPERWESETDAMNDAFMPYAIGSRDCVGQRLAVAELFSILPKLVPYYKFEIETEGKIDYFLTLKYSGTRLKVSKAV